jgi:hypothetical protein
MVTKGNIDHRPATKLANQACGSGGVSQPKGHSIGTGHKRSESLSNFGGSSHRVGGGKSNLLPGGKGVFGK